MDKSQNFSENAGKFPRKSFDMKTFRYKIDPGDPRKKFRTWTVAAFLALLICSVGCNCVKTKDKPGIILRGDWSLEMNRTEAIARISDDFTCDTRAITKKRSSRSEHKTPCGRFGCFRCALAPSTGESELENEEEEADEGIQSLDRSMQIGAQGLPGMLPPGAYYPGGAIPGPMGFPPGVFPGAVPGPVPGFIPGTFAPPPIAVINPQNGQRMVLNPALPGQPGILMLNAATGQPVLMNPNPPQIHALGFVPQGSSNPGMLVQGAPVPGPIAGMQHAGTQSAMGFPHPNAQMFPMGAAGPGNFPIHGVGVSPQYANTQFPTGQAVNPFTGLPLAPQGMNPQIAGNPENGSPEEEDQEKLRSNMPYPRFHSLPTKPVFQRTEGLAKTDEIEKESKERIQLLEQALGKKIPESAKISPNGINQQILPANAVSGKGGGPVDGSPFPSISGILGIHDDSGNSASASGTHDVKEKQIQLQLREQKKQIQRLQKELEKKDDSLHSSAKKEKKNESKDEKTKGKLKLPSISVAESISKLSPAQLFAPSEEVAQNARILKENAELKAMLKNDVAERESVKLNKNIGEIEIDAMEFDSEETAFGDFDEESFRRIEKKEDMRKVGISGENKTAGFFSKDRIWSVPLKPTLPSRPTGIGTSARSVKARPIPAAGSVAMSSPKQVSVPMIANSAPKTRAPQLVARRDCPPSSRNYAGNIHCPPWYQNQKTNRNPGATEERFAQSSPNSIRQVAGSPSQTHRPKMVVSTDPNEVEYEDTEAPISRETEGSPHLPPLKEESTFYKDVVQSLLQDDYNPEKESGFHPGIKAAPFPSEREKKPDTETANPDRPASREKNKPVFTTPGLKFGKK